jgi:Flp pilus assembly pilin Flp
MGRMIATVVCLRAREGGAVRVEFGLLVALLALAWVGAGVVLGQARVPLVRVAGF